MANLWIKISVRIWLSRDGGRQQPLMRNPTRGEDKRVQPLLFFCPFISISWNFSTVACKTIIFLLAKNKRTLTSSDDNSTSERKQIKLKLNPSLPLYSTVASPLSATVSYVAAEFLKRRASESRSDWKWDDHGKTNSPWHCTTEKQRWNEGKDLFSSILI